MSRSNSTNRLPPALCSFIAVLASPSPGRQPPVFLSPRRPEERHMDWLLLLEWAVKSLVLIFGLLGGFAYLTWYERKVLARMQVRYGPNRAGPKGLLQPIADAVKLIFKE